MLNTNFESLFSEQRNLRFPTNICFGWGVIKYLKDFVIEKNIKTTLIVTDPGIIKAGILENPISILKESNIRVEIYDGVQPEPETLNVKEAVSRGREINADVVIGIGGGSSLDVAKVTAVLIKHNTNLENCLGMNNMPGKGLPVILIPTTTGTGSETTRVSVLSDPEDGHNKKVAYDSALFGDLILVDPFLSMYLPPRITAMSGIDALSHAIEAFVNINRNPLSDAFAKEAIKRLAANIRPAVLKGSERPEARYNMALGAMLGGLALNSSGAGATHALNYPLGIKYGLPHGESIAILLPYVMKFNVPVDIVRYAEISELLGVEKKENMTIRDFAEAGCTMIENISSDIGINIKLSDFVKSEDEFDGMANIAIKFSSHNLKSNPREPSKEDIINIYKVAYKK
jgi:alcohol dehydrogenase